MFEGVPDMCHIHVLCEVFADLGVLMGGGMLDVGVALAVCGDCDYDCVCVGCQRTAVMAAAMNWRDGSLTHIGRYHLFRSKAKTTPGVQQCTSKTCTRT